MCMLFGDGFRCEGGKRKLVCVSTAWKCHDRRECVPKESLCDGKYDCDDKSDEKCDADGNPPPETLEEDTDKGIPAK